LPYSKSSYKAVKGSNYCLSINGLFAGTACPMEFIFLFIPSGLNPYLIFNRGLISFSSKAENFLMNNYYPNPHILNYRELREAGWAVLRTDSSNLIFTLRDCYMLDVFDLDLSAHVAYLDFDIKKKIMLGDAFGSPAIGLPFSNQFRKIFGKEIFPFKELRSRHNVGFFVEEAYRNKGKKRLWNMDEVLMAIALEIAFEEGIEIFIIKPTGERYRYYCNKFYAEIHPTTESDVILGVDLRSARKKLKHVKLQTIEGKTHFFRVTYQQDTIITP